MRSEASSPTATRITLGAPCSTATAPPHNSSKGRLHAKHRPQGDSPLAKLPGKACAVFADDRTTVFRVPREDVIFIPAASVRADETPCDVLTMCPAFARAGVCGAASNCPHAHVNTARSATHAAHVRPDDAATTKRLSELCGPAVLLAPSPERNHSQHQAEGPPREGDWVLLSQCLHTLAPIEKWCDSHDSSGSSHHLASDGSRTFAGSHCAYWTNSGYCHFGKFCRFVHALPSARTPLVHPAAKADAAPLAADVDDGSLHSLSPEDTTHVQGCRRLDGPASTPCAWHQHRRQHDPYTARPIRVGLSPLCE